MDKRVREAERRYQQESSPDNLYRLYIIRMQAGDYEPDEEIIEEIIDHAARAFFVESWAREMEERDQYPAGVELSDAAPATPVDAIDSTRNYIREVEKDKKLPIDVFYRFIGQLPRDPYWGKDYTPENFGHYLAMSALGSGVGLWEIVPVPLQHYAEVPYGDNYDYDDFSVLVAELNDDPDIQRQVIGLINGQIDPENFGSVQQWLRQAYHRPSNPSLIMTALDEILDGYGVESAETENGSHFSYVNMGDSYILTVVYDGDFHITSYGDYMEQMDVEDEDDDWDEE